MLRNTAKIENPFIDKLVDKDLTDLLGIATYNFKYDYSH